MKTSSAYGTADLGFMGYTRDGIQGFCVSIMCTWKSAIQKQENGSNGDKPGKSW